MPQPLKIGARTIPTESHPMYLGMGKFKQHLELFLLNVVFQSLSKRIQPGSKDDVTNQS